MRTKVINEWLVSYSSSNSDFSPPLALAKDLEANPYWTENDEEKQ